MSGLAALSNRRAVLLLGCLFLQRISGAGLPVALLVVSVDLRGYAAAATIQGVRVFAGTFSAPFRARLLDRVGRNRVIVPQTVLFSVSLLLFAVAVVVESVPLAVVLFATLLPALTSPSTNSVIRTLWRTIGSDEHEVKALHAYDSIIEEIAYLAGPLLASVLMLGIGQSETLFVIVAATICGFGLALLSPDVRSALPPRSTASKEPAARESKDGRLRRSVRTLAGPIASRDLQRIVLPLIMMGSVFGVVGILAPALCAANGRSDNAGFLLATISLGGVIGALAYGAAKVEWALRTRHAALGLVFGAPLLFAVLADSPWSLGVLLTLAGLAVTPLYINSYLMMDAEIPDSVIHEANTWVPVGNNVGYVFGITVAAGLLDEQSIPGALVLISVLAAIMVVYSAFQLTASQAHDVEHSDASDSPAEMLTESPSPSGKTSTGA